MGSPRIYASSLRAAGILVVDTSEFKDGKQSLKFAVSSRASEGGWHSPGLRKELEATSGATYRIGFWGQERRR